MHSTWDSTLGLAYLNLRFSGLVSCLAGTGISSLKQYIWLCYPFVYLPQHPVEHSGFVLD